MVAIMFSFFLEVSNSSKENWNFSSDFMKPVPELVTQSTVFLIHMLSFKKILDHA